MSTEMETIPTNFPLEFFLDFSHRYINQIHDYCWANQMLDFNNSTEAHLHIVAIFLRAYRASCKETSHKRHSSKHYAADDQWSWIYYYYYDTSLHFNSDVYRNDAHAFT